MLYRAFVGNFVQHQALGCQNAAIVIGYEEAGRLIGLDGMLHEISFFPIAT